MAAGFDTGDTKRQQKYFDSVAFRAEVEAAVDRYYEQKHTLREGAIGNLMSSTGKPRRLVEEAWAKLLRERDDI